MASPTPLGQADLDDIVLGACALGCGGGGPLAMARAVAGYLASLPEKVMVADPATDVDDGAMAAAVLALGAPDVPVSLSSLLQIFIQTFDRLNDLHHGQLTHVLLGEVGAGCLVPMVVAAAKGIPVIDASGAPRAVPSLTMTTFASNGVPISPIVATNVQGESQVLSAAGAQEAEESLRKLVQQPGWKGVAVACWTMSGSAVKQHALPGALTRARTLGKAARDALARGGDPVEAWRAALGGRVLARGRMRVQSNQDVGGFQSGSTAIQPDGQGPSLIVSYLNENLIAWDGGHQQPILTAPDLICYVRARSGEPFTNADLAIAPDSLQGEDVAVIGAPAPSAFREQAILDAFQESFRALGYGGPPVPYRP